MFFTHVFYHWGLGTRHVTCGASSSFCCVRHCRLPAHTPEDFMFLFLGQHNVQTLNLFRYFQSKALSVMLFVLALNLQ